MHDSEKWKWSRSVVSDFTTPWTAAYQAPPPMGFSRQGYRSGVPLPSPLFHLSCSSKHSGYYIWFRPLLHFTHNSFQALVMCTFMVALVENFIYIWIIFELHWSFFDHIWTGELGQESAASPPSVHSKLSQALDSILSLKSSQASQVAQW